MRCLGFLPMNSELAILSGQLPMPMLEEVVGGGFEQNPHITTLGGFVMQRLGRLPRENDSFVDSGYDFYVARMHGRQVHTVMISPSKKTKQNLDTAPVDGNTG